MVAILALSFAGHATAREESEEFVTALRARGLNELTLDYLSRMESSPLADAEFKRRIEFHRGRALVDLARATADRDQRVPLLDQAKQELEQFASANTDSIDGAEALTELANVLVEQGKQLLADADALPEGATYASERRTARGSARGAFSEARSAFQRAEAFYTDALEKFPKVLDPKTESDQITLRQEYRGRAAQMSVLAAQTQFELAFTYAPGSAEFHRIHQSNADELAGLFDKYSRWLVGFYARLYEGRSYQAIKDYTRALGCYEELIAQPSIHPAFRKLIASAYGYKTECLVEQGDYTAAIAGATACLEAARDDEVDTPEWQMVRYRLAQALQQKAAAPNSKPTEQRRLQADARDAYTAVAAMPGEFQQAAGVALVALGSQPRLNRARPHDFAAAYEAGKQAMASVNAAKLALPSAERNNPSAIPELREQMEQGKTDAREDFRLALTLVDDDTDLNKLNEVRYFLCWLNWENKDYYQAAVLGEFLARRYPDHPAAAAAAKLALASFERLQRAALVAGGGADDTEFEARRMARIAEFITRRWPGTQAADTAQRVLVNYAIRTDRIDDAKALLEQVSPAARPALEAQLGNSIWAHYLELSQRDGPNRPDEATLARHRADAVKLLEDAVAAVRTSGKMSELAATSALYLVQAQLTESNYTEAVRLLEEPKVGPLSLVASHHTAAARPEYIIEVYKAALRAYVSATPPQAQKAIDMIDRLEQAVGQSDGGGSDRLTPVYISLAVALNEQVDELHAAGRDAEANRVRNAFAELLDQISDRLEGSSFASRVWIAQSYYNLGESFARTSSRDTTRSYFTKARNAYQTLLDELEQDPSLAPSPTARLAVEKQLGECYLQLGEYKQALDTFSAVLKEQESQLSVQQAAAETYQQWGTSGNPKWLERAIYGGYKLRSTGKNRIWGWVRLALVAERAARANPTYWDAFFEARLQAARCRFLIGTKAQGAVQEQHFATAKQSIRSMLELYPELGGSKWRTKFDRLLRQIQTASQEQPTGLQEFASTRS